MFILHALCAIPSAHRAWNRTPLCADSSCWTLSGSSYWSSSWPSSCTCPEFFTLSSLLEFWHCRCSKLDSSAASHVRRKQPLCFSRWVAWQWVPVQHRNRTAFSWCKWFIPKWATSWKKVTLYTPSISIYPSIYFILSYLYLISISLSLYLSIFLSIYLAIYICRGSWIHELGIPSPSQMERGGSLAKMERTWTTWTMGHRGTQEILAMIPSWKPLAFLGGMWIQFMQLGLKTDDLLIICFQGTGS